MKKLTFLLCSLALTAFAQIGPQPPEVTQMAVNSSQNGAYAQVSVTGNAPKGISDLAHVMGVIGDPFTYTPRCMVLLLDRSTVWLLNDAGDGWLGGYFIGANASTENSYCKIQPLTASVTTNGTAATFRYDVSLKAALNGVRPVYAIASDANWNTGNNQYGQTGWLGYGTFNVNAGQPLGYPAITGLSPASGSSATPTYTATATVPKGITDLQHFVVLVGDASNPVNSCYMLLYHRDYFLLLNDAGSAWLGNLPIGSNNVVENSQCSVNLANIGVLISGNNITFTVAPVFKPAFAGIHPVFGVATDANWGSAGGWINYGNWTVPPPIPEGVINALQVAPGAIVIDDATGGTTISTTSAGTDAGYLAVRLSSGRKLKIADASRVKVHRADYAHKLSGDARVYTFHLDLTGGVKKIRLGTMNNSRYAIGDDPDVPFSKPQVTGPRGWYGSGVGWVSLDGADFSDEAEFTVASHYLPGPMPLYLMNKHWSDAVEMTGHGDDELAMATGFMSNSLQRWVIGPAFRPGITQDELKSLIGDWIAIDPQFAFLKPLLDESGTLDTLQPPDGKLAAETIECLRAVWGVK